MQPSLALRKHPTLTALVICGYASRTASVRCTATSIIDRLLAVLSNNQSTSPASCATMVKILACQLLHMIPVCGLQHAVSDLWSSVSRVRTCGVAR